MHELNALDPRHFPALLAAREAAFAAAPATFPAQPYGVNALADALHPKQQALTVSAVQELAPNCRVYTLVPDAARGTERLAVFRPGQYLSVRLQMGDAVTTRTCTFCASPAVRDSYTVTLMDHDEATHHIFTHWAVGTPVEASAPLGDFCYEALRDAGHVLAVAEGTGVLPFLSMAQAIADGSAAFFLTLCYFAPAPHLETLAALAAACPRLSLVQISSPEELSAHLPQQEYTAFLALSRDKRTQIGALLQSAAHAPQNVRQSLCHAPSDPLPPFPVILTVQLYGRKLSIPGQSNETVLAILERSGIPAPSHCRSGHCGWCRARLLSGEVWLPEENDNRRLADLKHNIIHPCCSYPRSDLTIEIAAT